MHDFLKSLKTVEQPTVPKDRWISYFALYKDPRQFYMVKDPIWKTKNMYFYLVKGVITLLILKTMLNINILAKLLFWMIPQ